MADSDQNIRACFMLFIQVVINLYITYTGSFLFLRVYCISGFHIANACFHFTFLSDSVLLECGGRNNANIFWKRGEHFIGVKTFIIYTELTDNLVIFGNNSLLIKSMSFNDEGFYRCERNSTTEISVHQLEVKGLYISSTKLYEIWNK